MKVELKEVMEIVDHIKSQVKSVSGDLIFRLGFNNATVMITEAIMKLETEKLRAENDGRNNSGEFKRSIPEPNI